MLLALESGPARRFALERVTAALAAHQIELGVDDLQYDLSAVRFERGTLRLLPPRRPSLPEFATIGPARLDLSLADLVRGRYVVQAGELQDVNLQYVVDVDGQDNLP